MMKHEIEIELRRSLEGTHRYSSMSSGRGISPPPLASPQMTLATTTPSSASSGGVGKGIARNDSAHNAAASNGGVGRGIASNGRGAEQLSASDGATNGGGTGVGIAEQRTEVRGQLATTSRTGVLYPQLSYEIVGAAIEVHRWLGPGQLESNYQRAMQKELAMRGIPYRAQVPIASRYKGEDIGEFFVDLIVDDAVVLELKAVSAVLPVHRAQLMSYLRTTGCRLGMLMNFHLPVMVQGIKRIAL